MQMSSDKELGSTRKDKITGISCKFRKLSFSEKWGSNCTTSFAGSLLSLSELEHQEKTKGRSVRKTSPRMKIGLKSDVLHYF